MTDDRRRDGDDHVTDSTIGMAVAEGQRAADSNRRADSTFDMHGPNSAFAGGTLDLPASDQVAPRSSLDPGQVIGRFILGKQLGQGGMGVVLMGHDADLGRPVAIKVVKDRADHPAYRARLLREAQVMARLEHPNVIRVYEVGTDRDRLYVAMEYVDGVTLTMWLKAQRRTWREIIAMFTKIGHGLAAVHAAGLVHRDFKPDNVLVDRDGRPRVADFGLARIDPDMQSTNTPQLAASLTRTGMLVGTPAYMAPEQHFGSDVDARADQFSFCLSLREALVGTLSAKIDEAQWGGVPRAVRAVIERGAAMEANERFPTMNDLLAALAGASSRRMLYIGATAAVVVAGGISAAITIALTSSSSSAPTKPAPIVTSIEVDAAIAIAPDAAVNFASTPDAPIEPKPQPIAPKPIAKNDARKPVEAKPGETTTIGGTVITQMSPVKETADAKKHNLEGDKPPTHEMVAAHRSAVRDAVRDFGFGGLTITGTDRDADLAALETQLAAATGKLERGAILYAMGQTERLRDNCGAAAKHWRDAKVELMDETRGAIDSVEKEKRRTKAFSFWGRSVIGEGFCALLAGKALGTEAKLESGLRNIFTANDNERAEAWFALGIVYWETGDEEQGKRMFELAVRRGSEKLREAIAAYFTAVGIKL